MIPFKGSSSIYPRDQQNGVLRYGFQIYTGKVGGKKEQNLRSKGSEELNRTTHQQNHHGFLYRYTAFPVSA